MTAARQRVGRRGEEIAAARLAAEGWRILARNCRVPDVRGELDIVALERGTLVFVEVKTMRADAVRGPATPAAMVGRRKQLKLRALAAAWLRHRAGALGYVGLRFDVVALRLDRDDRVAEWDHIRAAF